MLSYAANNHNITFGVHPTVPVKLSRVLQLVANEFNQNREVSVRFVTKESI